MASWSKPISNYYKINVKGVFDRAQMKASVGCVIRNSQGAWEGGCGGMIGLADPTTAELWSVFYDLKEAWEREKTRAVLECESAEALQHIMNPDPGYALALLVDMIRGLLSENWEDLHVYHISPSANAAASALANLCLAAADGGVNSMVDPPSAIRGVLQAEM